MDRAIVQAANTSAHLMGRTVTILGQELEVPAVSSELGVHRSKIEDAARRARQRNRTIGRPRQVTKTELRMRERPPLLGFIPRAPVEEEVEVKVEVLEPMDVPVSERERFAALDEVVDNYDALVAHLVESQGAYQAFFSQLGRATSLAVSREISELRTTDEERRELAADAVRLNQTELLAVTAETEASIKRSLRTLGYAALLILRKLKLASDAISTFASDTENQRKVAERLRVGVDLHRRARKNQKRALGIERRVNEMAQVATDLERYLSDYVGPIQMVIEQMCAADETLARAAAEIEGLAGRLTTETPSSGAEEDFVLNALLNAELKRNVVPALLSALESEDGRAAEFDVQLATSGVDTGKVFQNIESLMQIGLQQLGVPSSSEEANQRVSIVSTVGPVVRRVRRPEPIVSCPQWATEHGADKFGTWSQAEVGKEVLRARWIPPGEFVMGASETETGATPQERPAHQVTISRGFWIAETTVTDALWRAVLGEIDQQSQLPRVQVTWNEVDGWLGRLADVLSPENGWMWRLPTEAEWEYACRAETTTATYRKSVIRADGSSPQLEKIAWFRRNAPSVQPVGRLAPNPWGLFDMLGNVNEFTADAAPGYREGYPAKPKDPHRPGDSTFQRMARGGSYHDQATTCRAAARIWVAPDRRYKTVGFRFVCGPPLTR